MSKLSKKNEAVLIAYNKGYRVQNNGEVISHLGNNRSFYKDVFGYNHFSVKKDSISYNVKVAKLAAYQKYGGVIFESGIVVRHLDGDPENDSLDNIAIGSHSDNMMDIPRKVRVGKSRKAAKSQRKFLKEEIVELRKLLKFYPLVKLSEIYNVSKSTMSYIKNRKTYKNV